MEGKGLVRGVDQDDEKLRTLILEPVPDLSDAICAKLGPHLGQKYVGREITPGGELEAYGVELRTAAVLPIKGGTVDRNTHVHVTNRGERDAKLRELREKSEFFVCYYEGCDYLVGSFCCVCLRPVCVNHMTRCKNCGCPVCGDHLQKDGECSRCEPRPIADTMWGSAKEILGPIKIPLLAIVTLLIFGRVMLYGEQLRSIHPSLPMIIIVLYFGLQVPAAIFFAWRSRRREPRDSR
jgi:hypothetical protein